MIINIEEEGLGCFEMGDWIVCLVLGNEWGKKIGDWRFWERRKVSEIGVEF